MASAETITMTTLTPVLIEGFLTGAGLIIAIGAQNAFVLYQGLKKHYPFTIAVTCALVDMLLIFLGYAGLGVLVKKYPIVHQLALYFGVSFLLYYGFKAFNRARKNETLQAESEERINSYSKAIAVTLAFSLLNPHVYLDTVVLLGSISSQYTPPLNFYFALGAMVASIVWFMALAFGARVIAPLFKQPLAWKILDIFIGVVMWWIATKLALNYMATA